MDYGYDHYYDVYDNDEFLTNVKMNIFIVEIVIWLLFICCLCGIVCLIFAVFGWLFASKMPHYDTYQINKHQDCELQNFV